MFFDHILVAADFSPAWPVLSCRLGHFKGWGTTRLTLVHVLDSHYPAAPAETHRAHYQESLAEIAADLSSLGFAVDYQVRDGDPALELVEAAKETLAGAILVGSHGHSRLRELFFGSVVLNLARLADRPVWLEPTFDCSSGEAEAIPLESAAILLATDGSAGAVGAEHLFETLAPKVDRALALQVVSRGESRSSEAEEAEAVRHLESLAARVEGVVTRIEHGHPAAVISRVSEEESADLVVIGKRGRNPIREILLGSTVEGVCRRAERPVLIVPAAS